jgi:hypothetical protein
MIFPSCKNSENDETFYSWCTGCLIEAGRHGCALEETDEVGKYIFKGNTPNGGSKALLFFKDENDKLVPKMEATFVEIQELDDNDRMVHVDHGTFDPYRPPNTLKENE